MLMHGVHLSSLCLRLFWPLASAGAAKDAWCWRLPLVHVAHSLPTAAAPSPVQVASLMAESKDFNNFVADPSVPRETKVDGLNSILTKMGATDVTKNFVGAPRGAACAAG